MNFAGAAQASARGLRKNASKILANEAVDTQGAFAKAFNYVRDQADDMVGHYGLAQKVMPDRITSQRMVKNTIDGAAEGGQDQLKAMRDLYKNEQQKAINAQKAYGGAFTTEANAKKLENLKAQESVFGSEVSKIENAMAGQNGARGANYDFNTAPGVGSRLKHAGQGIKDYYSTGDAGTIAAKVGVSAGVYGAGAVGLRYAGGGTLTRNNRGESDIAGIPII